MANKDEWAEAQAVLQGIVDAAVIAVMRRRDFDVSRVVEMTDKEKDWLLSVVADALGAHTRREKTRDEEVSAGEVQCILRASERRD